MPKTKLKDRAPAVQTPEGVAIKNVRLNRLMTGADLAHASGVSAKAICQIELGRVVPNSATIDKLANVLGPLALRREIVAEYERQAKPLPVSVQPDRPAAQNHPTADNFGAWVKFVWQVAMPGDSAADRERDRATLMSLLCLTPAPGEKVVVSLAGLLRRTRLTDDRSVKASVARLEANGLVRQVGDDVAINFDALKSLQRDAAWLEHPGHGSLGRCVGYVRPRRLAEAMAAHAAERAEQVRVVEGE